MNRHYPSSFLNSCWSVKEVSKQNNHICRIWLGWWDNGQNAVVDEDEDEERMKSFWTWGLCEAGSYVVQGRALVLGSCSGSEPPAPSLNPSSSLRRTPPSSSQAPETPSLPPPSVPAFGGQGNECSHFEVFLLLLLLKIQWVQEAPQHTLSKAIIPNSHTPTDKSQLESTS